MTQDEIISLAREAGLGEPVVYYAYATINEYEELAGFSVSEAFRAGWNMARTTNSMLGINAAPVSAPKQEPVAWKETVRALTDQVAALVWERDELQKQVQRYERNGVTCQLYGHKVERSCAECNEDQLYVAPVSAEAIRAEALEEAAAMGEESIRIWGDQDGRMVEVVAAIRRLK